MINFLNNHGLLNLFRGPQWFSIKGGSNQYIEKIIEKGSKKKISLATLYNTVHAFKEKGYLKEISINCENIAANQIKILGFKIEIANPCIKELTFFCSFSNERLCAVSRKNKMPRINKNTLP